MDDLTTRKAEARQRALAAREALPPAYRAQAGLAILRDAEALGVTPGMVVSGFLPIRTEIDLQPLLVDLAGRGARLALPVMLDRSRLAFRAWAPGDTLVERLWGIREPSPEAALVDPDLVLAPLAAFDRAGHRLGHGRGYYDGALARLRASKPIRAIGVAFACQELPSVPAGPHDQPLDAVLTEQGLLTMGRAS